MSWKVNWRVDWRKDSSSKHDWRRQLALRAPAASPQCPPCRLVLHRQRLYGEPNSHPVIEQTTNQKKTGVNVGAKSQGNEVARLQTSMLDPPTINLGKSQDPHSHGNTGPHQRPPCWTRARARVRVSTGPHQRPPCWTHARARVRVSTGPYQRPPCWTHARARVRVSTGPPQRPPCWTHARARVRVSTGPHQRPPCWTHAREGGQPIGNKHAPLLYAVVSARTKLGGESVRRVKWTRPQRQRLHLTNYKISEARIR
jgi:hypothetical protein